MINFVWILYASKWLVFPKQRIEISIFQFYSMNVIYDKNSVVMWQRLSIIIASSSWGLKGIKKFNDQISFPFIFLSWETSVIWLA